MKSASKNLLVLMFSCLYFINVQKCRSQNFQGYSNENLTLCIDKKEKKISGFINANLYVDNDTESGVYQSCNLFFKGNFKDLDNSIEISVFNSFELMQFTSGNIIIDEELKTCKISLKDHSISCSNIFDLKSGEIFNLDSPLRLLKCTRILADRSFFWDNGKRKKTYLVKGDFVAIIEEQKNTYLKILYVNKNLITTTGWIKKTDVE